jgi:hypothetical protein
MTLSNCPAPSACSISTPEASSLYATTTIPGRRKGAGTRADDRRKARR